MATNSSVSQLMQHFNKGQKIDAPSQNHHSLQANHLQ